MHVSLACDSSNENAPKIIPSVPLSLILRQLVLPSRKKEVYKRIISVIFLPSSVRGWTSAFLLSVHRLRGWLRGDWAIFYHAGPGWVGRVWSAGEKSLEILRRGWDWNPAYGENRQWGTFIFPLSYHDCVSSFFTAVKHCHCEDGVPLCTKGTRLLCAAWHCKYKVL